MKMKKLTFALFAVLLLSLSSCQKATNDSIVGTWTYTANSGTADVVTDNPAVTAYIVSDIKSGQSAGGFVFAADGTYTFPGMSPYNDSGTYTVSGDTLTLIAAGNIPFIIPFTIDGNVLKISQDRIAFYKLLLPYMGIPNAENTTITKAISTRTLTRQ